ncbi:hypothetical protein [Pseudomonas syringae]|uniref:hypothetical protein n=1 Tax=Pseudomonas syringae TaxID=317 RepID=UPI001F44AD8F|nr:hypothetical protein [Pseudomonas syringae]MCF9000504.1 hypothetical protein [Pseudomonas syringae]
MENNVSLGFLIQKSESDKAKIAELEERISHQRDDKPDHQADTPTMTESHDYRHELSLRDEQLRREMDLRQESFRAEQALRDKALEERFAGFFAAQSERDKAFEKVSDARFDRIEKDVASIKADTKTVSLEVVGIRLVIAKYVGGAIVVVAIASAALTAGSKYLFS